LTNANPNLHKPALTPSVSCQTIGLVPKGTAMPTQSSASTPNRKTDRSHAPENSVFFDRVVPVLLIAMGILTVFLILFAAGVLLGIIHF
jgi:hypothetical protein